MTAVLGHLAQLVVQGLNSVGGVHDAAPRGRGALGTAWTGLGPLPRRRRLGVAGAGSDSAKSSKAPRAASSPSGGAGVLGSGGGPPRGPL